MSAKEKAVRFINIDGNKSGMTTRFQRYISRPKHSESGGRGFTVIIVRTATPPHLGGIPPIAAVG